MIVANKKDGSFTLEVSVLVAWPSDSPNVRLLKFA